MSRSTRSTNQKDQKPLSRKQLKEAALNPGKRALSSTTIDPQPQKKLKPTASKDSKAGKVTQTDKKLKATQSKDNKISLEKDKKDALKSKDNKISLEKNKKDVSKSPDQSKKSNKSPVKQTVKPAVKQAVKPTQQKKEVKVILKGKIPVDPHAQHQNTRVLVHNGVVYASTLNQSNIKNNNNKFYIIQVLQLQANPSSCYFFTRWGRVGVVGQSSQALMSRDMAMRQYMSKLNSKTKAGQYRVVQMNYQQNVQQTKKVETKNQNNKQQQIKSTLDPKVQDLIRLIFDMKMMNNQMKQIGYDAEKMPLGKLAKTSIMKGYQSLKKLMQQVKTKKRKQVFNQQSSDFYSYIPHDFGFKNMANFILDTQPKIRAKLQMLQSLEDIQIFTKLLGQGKIANDMNELDSNYLKLNTQITALDQNSNQFKVIKKYVQNTHATSHNQYKLGIEQVYCLKKDIQKQRYLKDIHNKQLLWHGSRLTNYVGILSQGLRIAPPQAPVTGYMFGKGVYFADMVSKSANYCFTNSTNTTGLMLLCQVALGEQNQKYAADYYANLLPDGKNSTKGCGKTAPNGGQKLEQIWVPNGKGQNVNLKQPSSLLYNQFIVYDIAQIQCKYLLKMNFVYKK